MARKRRSHQWTQDEDAMPEPAERRDRNEERSQEKELRALALRLAAMTPAQRQQLPLDELLLDEIVHLAGLGRKSAHRRQLLRVQGLLRLEDLDPLLAHLEGATEDRGRLLGLERWRARLLEGGDADLSAYIEAHPSVDRQRLRALIRQARREGHGGKDAARRLFQLLKAAVEERSD